MTRFVAQAFPGRMLPPEESSANVTSILNLGRFRSGQFRGHLVYDQRVGSLVENGLATVMRIPHYGRVFVFVRESAQRKAIASGTGFDDWV
jgi:hypothetical protein